MVSLDKAYAFRSLVKELGKRQVLSQRIKFLKMAAWFVEAFSYLMMTKKNGVLSSAWYVGIRVFKLKRRRASASEYIKVKESSTLYWDVSKNTNSHHFGFALPDNIESKVLTLQIRKKWLPHKTRRLKVKLLASFSIYFNIC